MTTSWSVLHLVHLLQGYSLLQLVGMAEGEGDQVSAADERAASMLLGAVSSLFAAASALGQDATSDFDCEADQIDIDLMGQDGFGLDSGTAGGHHAALAMMRHVLACLARDLTGLHPTPSLQARPVGPHTCSSSKPQTSYAKQSSEPRLEPTFHVSLF